MKGEKTPLGEKRVTRAAVDVSETIEPTPKKPRGRSRRSGNEGATEQESSLSETPSEKFSTPHSNGHSTPVPKKRGRKAKESVTPACDVEGKTDEETIATPSPSPHVVNKRRGRPPINPRVEPPELKGGEIDTEDSQEEGEDIGSYTDYMGRLEEFRLLEPRLMVRLIFRYAAKHREIPCLGKFCKRTLSSREGMVYHVKHCKNQETANGEPEVLAPKGLTYMDYRGKIEDFRKLCKKERRRLMKTYIDKHRTISCLNPQCTKSLGTYEGMIYHVHQCGNEECWVTCTVCVRTLRDYNIDQHMNTHRPPEELAFEIDEDYLLERIGSGKFKWSEEDSQDNGDVTFNGFSIRKGDFVPEFGNSEGRRKRKSATMARSKLSGLLKVELDSDGEEVVSQKPSKKGKADSDNEFYEKSNSASSESEPDEGDDMEEADLRDRSSMPDDEQISAPPRRSLIAAALAFRSVTFQGAPLSEASKMALMHHQFLRDNQRELECRLKYPDWLKKSVNTSLTVLQSFKLNNNGFNKGDLLGLNYQSLAVATSTAGEGSSLSIFSPLRLTAGDLVTFVGGPVTVCRWIPLRSYRLNTVRNVKETDYVGYMLVVADRSPFLKIDSSSDALVQIHRVTLSKDPLAVDPVQSCNVCYCLKVPAVGNIWSATFSPLPTSQDVTGVMAVVAFATQSGRVVVLNLPDPECFMDPKNATVPVFSAQIALELSWSSDMPCLSAQWLPYGAMNKVVASYAHGLVAVWNVWKTSPLLREDNRLQPTLTIQVDTAPIRNLYWLDDDKIVVFGTHLSIYSTVSGDLLHQESDSLTIATICPVYFKSSLLLISHKGLYRPGCKSSAMVTDVASRTWIPIATHLTTVWSFATSSIGHVVSADDSGVAYCTRPNFAVVRAKKRNRSRSYNPLLQKKLVNSQEEHKCDFTSLEECLHAGCFIRLLSPTDKLTKQIAGDTSTGRNDSPPLAALLCADVLDSFECLPDGTDVPRAFFYCIAGQPGLVHIGKLPDR